MQFLIAFDQLLNTLLGGMADETLSARAWRLDGISPGWSAARRLIDALFFWQAGHCEQAYLAEQQRKQLPTVYR